MTDRSIDFFVKGLSFDVRQEVFQGLDKIGLGKIEKLLEKNDGYPIYRSMGYSDDQIANQEAKSVVRFQAVNDIMTSNERYPLFSNPEDTYQSAKEYLNLLKKKSKEELLAEFGCLWEDYIPRVYIKKNNIIDQQCIEEK